MLQTPSTPISAPLLSALHVDREDITFANLAPGLVRVRVRVHHRGTLPTPATVLILRAAPFGAFVRSRPVAKLQLPALLPRQSTTVATALTSPALRRKQRRAQLPPDPLRHLDPTRTNWAGNFDVLIDDQKRSERHQATSLPLVPGRANFAVFEVGDRLDDYRFSFRGPGQDWRPRLTAGYGEATRAILGLAGRIGAEISPDVWVTRKPARAVTLSFHPPAEARQGLLAVAVEQRSTGRQTLVEFGFGVDTIPPGCFPI